MGPASPKGAALHRARCQFDAELLNHALKRVCPIDVSLCSGLLSLPCLAPDQVGNAIAQHDLGLPGRGDQSAWSRLFAIRHASTFAEASSKRIPTVPNQKLKFGVVRNAT